MSTYRISKLAEVSGIPATTLRFYETAGLLSAERTASGYRVYGDEAVERLAFIASARIRKSAGTPPSAAPTIRGARSGAYWSRILAVPLVAMACAGISEVPTFGEWFGPR